MSPDQTKRMVLGVLLVALAVLVARGGWWSAGTVEPPPQSAQAAPGREADVVSGLQLDRLDAAGSIAPIVRRNLFRFAETGSPGPGRPSALPQGRTPAPAVDRSPPPPPRATFTLIGIVEARGEGARVAVLSDGRGVYHGTAGDIIEGQFRIVSVGLESVEMARLDDETRQVIRLQGAGASRPVLQ